MYDFIEQQEVNNDIKAKGDKVSSSTDSFNNFAKESRAINKEFFFQVSVVAAGIVSLSVTFVGYLVNNPNYDVHHIFLLYIGWFFLTTATLSGLYRNFVYTTFGHYQINKNRVRALLELDEVLLTLATKYPDQIANIKTNEELEKYRETLRSNIDNYETGLVYNEKKEKLWEIMWKTCENTAIIGLGLGLVSIVIFAALNIPTS